MFRAAFNLVFALAICLAIAEGTLWFRDDGTFPHLNIYSEDAELGVRLRPGALQRVRFGGNPTTSVRINRQGYRGGEWPADAQDAIAVLGDSQVFGLGVEENETFSARLAEITARPVLNAGVPTLGPPEMLQIARELMTTRKPRTLILTINVLDDLFEVGRPNRERHRVWDGWAVRIETAPAAITPFPWRDIVTTKSHLVFGVRRYLHERSAPKLGTLPSEGSWKDLVTLAAAIGERQEAAHGIEEFRGNPTDIVSASALGEPARSPELSVFQLQRAALTRAIADKEHATRAARQAALGKLRDPRREPLPPSGPTCALDGVLRDFAELCRAPTCEPMLVVLPVDLQVSPEEWRKYDLEPHDIGNAQSLTDEIVRSATDYGIRALDTTTSLRDSEPGAFLKADVHMTPKGHAAVAGAIATALSKPAPLPRATGALPDGRSRVPSAEELAKAGAIVIRGSEMTGCQAVQVDEWLRVQCQRGPRNVPRRIDLVSGSGDAFINASADVISIVAPVLADTPLAVDVAWADRVQRLHAKLDAKGKIVSVLDPPKRKMVAAAPTSREQEALCACSRLVTSSNDCTAVYGSTRPECFTTYPVQQPDLEVCRRLLECAQGSALSPPSCPEGATVAGGTSQCFRQCSEAVPCASGKCVPWPQTQVCMGQP